jgi:hypothetical protein
MNYTQYQQQIANLMPTTTTDPTFLIMLPGAIDYCEQRVMRELDLVSTTVTDSTGSLSASNRNFTLPTGALYTGSIFVTVDSLSVILPAGTSASAGSRQQLVPISKEWLDLSYPSSSTANGSPTYFAMITQGSVIVGPPPDGNYVVEVIGTQRPAPLSATNPTTFISVNLPDLLIAGTMIYVAGFQHNFSAQSDQPQAGSTWEAQFKTLMASAQVEEARKRFMGQGWSSQQPYQVTSPPRV